MIDEKRLVVNSGYFGSSAQRKKLDTNFDRLSVWRRNIRIFDLDLTSQ